MTKTNTRRVEKLEVTVARFGWTLCVALVCWAVLSSTALAGVIPGRWEKLQAQPKGTSVSLLMRSGEEVTGLYQGLTPEAVKIVESDATERVVPRAAVLKVQTSHKVPDRLGDGTAIGAVVGLGLGALSGAGDLNRSATIAFGGIFGAGLGFLIDKSLESPDTLFISK